MFSLTYTTKAGFKFARDYLDIADARRAALRIAKRIGRKVNVWSQGGRLVFQAGA